MLEIAKELIALRKKPSTEERFKAYPSLLQAFMQALEACDDVDTLKAVIALDTGYYLLAGYRQKVLEKWLSLERSPQALRLYAHQLMLFGDVDDFGAANTDVEARVEALEREADERDTPK
jgi:hypothetical protein